MTQLEILHSASLRDYIRVNVEVTNRAIQTVLIPKAEFEQFLRNDSAEINKTMRPFSRATANLLKIIGMKS